MTAVVIDYAGICSSEEGKKAVSEKRSGKFVQIRNDDREYLVFSTADLTPYHADIVERFCREKGLHGTYDGARKRFDISDTAWVIAGGGKFEIDKEQRYIRLYDNSMAYGRFDSQKLSEKIRGTDLPKDLEIRIE